MMHEAVIRALSEGEDSKLHRNLLDYARRRLEASERHWSQRHNRWRENEQIDRAFRVADSQDQQTRNDSLTLGVEKIVVPYSYAIRQSMLAFLLSTLKQRKPLIPVEADGAHDVRAAYLLEALLDTQASNMTPSLTLLWYQWFYDAFRYGVGIVKGMWTIEEWPEYERRLSPIVDPFTGQSMGMDEQVSLKHTVAYEGNQYLNIPPYDFLSDPNRPMADFGRGDFVFHHVRRSTNELRVREAEGLYIDIDRIPKEGTQAAYGAGGGLSQSDLARITEMTDPETEQPFDEYDRPYVSVHEGACRITPKELVRLGMPEAAVVGSDPDVPEVWFLTLANRTRVIRAENANLPGLMYPYAVVEPNYDWHSPSNVAMIEVWRGLQYYYSWLFNSRQIAVRKTLNAESVIDPGMVEENDLLDPEPGRLIRLKREVWGDGRVRDAVFPLPVQDTTIGHIGTDAPFVERLIQFVSGAPDIMTGMSSTGRRSASEKQLQAKAAAGRMSLILELFCEQGLKPQAKQMVKNTQAFIDLSRPLALRDPWRSILGMPYVQLTPDLLAGEFSFPFLDAGLPTDRQAEAAMWKELLMAGLQGNPQIMQMMPWPMIAARFFRAMNVKDLQSFGLSPLNLTVEPDQQVQDQVQQGNLQPMGEQGGVIRQASDGGAMPPYESIPGTGANGQRVGGSV